MRATLLLILASVCFGADATAPSVADLQAEIDALKAQIAAMRIPFNNGECFTFTPNPITIGYSYFDGTNTHTYMGNGRWQVTTVFRPGFVTTPTGCALIP